MQIWVLGPLEISHDGRSAVVRGAMPRRLLSLLALTPGREVRTDALVDQMWSDAASAASQATLQSHVARLRRDLPCPELLRTSHRGYVLDAAEDDVDAHRFEHAVMSGAQSLQRGDPARAGETLAEALTLWRGTPYAEFADCEALAAEARRLELLHVDAIERRISADLARPGVTPPVAELEALVRWYPTREGFWAMLMCAQYRLGRQGDAVATYQRARRTLVAELGVEPGPALAQIQRMVLDQDPALGLPLAPVLLCPTPMVGPYAERVQLVERDDLLDELGRLQQETLTGSGRLVLVHGEAGAGKTALVRRWAATVSPQAFVLWGACDPLSSPRALGPLFDVAPYLDSTVLDLLQSGEREGLFDAVLVALTHLEGAVLIVEDLQWADSSTLDLLRYLARRLDRTHALLVATYRDDDAAASSPLRVMLGDLASQPTVSRLDVPPLSPAGVAELAAGTAIDVEALHRETGGNPFFVTEVVAAGGELLPASVQDAVLARVHRLSPAARLALESAAVIGSRIEPTLLRAMPGVTAEGSDECVDAGMLRFAPPVYAFRHELVRQAVLTGISPGRLGALHWQVLERLREFPIHPRPYARLAEHAEVAGDAPATLEFALAAGDLAASRGSHREAAFQYGRALPHAELLAREDRLQLLLKRASECFITDEQHESIDASQRAIAMLREEDRPYELADALLRCYRSHTTIGDHVHSPPLIDEALATVRDLPPSPQLAIALAMHVMVQAPPDEALDKAERAVAIARQLDDPHVLAYTLNTLGFTLAITDVDAGLERMNESLQVALAHDLDDDAARSYNNLVWILLYDRRFDDTLPVVDEGMRYCMDHDLNGSYLCLLATRVSLLMDQGHWDEAEDGANELLYVRNTNRASRMEPLCALALLAARRGDVGTAWSLLDEAREHVKNAQIVDYDGFIAQSYGEVHLLQGDLDAVEAIVRPVFDRAVAEGVEQQDYITSLALLLWRAGRLDAAPLLALDAARLTIEGSPRAAFAAWMKDGFVYQAAWALLDSDDEVDLREARAMFQRLDAPVLVERVDAKLRAIGAKVPRGPRTSTRTNLGGLTDRELDVLDLLDAGLRNAEIAQQLCLSEKTVGHHVSAILAKLGASSRLEAVRRARDLAGVG
jgi:DNA-binding SARP family transcriptional activator/DNA-binding CsgD family transcriptional regulator/tetratricopeptide (TPR) repeat protein